MTLLLCKCICFDLFVIFRCPELLWSSKTPMEDKIFVICIYSRIGAAEGMIFITESFPHFALRILKSVLLSSKKKNLFNRN